ncbi:hypothetical protein M2140_000865 [Clostridiales Family XIII bacterium PM5-7]
MGKKVLVVIIALTVIAGCFVLNGCKEKEEPVETQSELEPFVGAWECEGNPLNDPQYYTGYLKLEIQEDGTFSMYDAEAGNPGLSGKLIINENDELELDCDEVEFDPPPNWSDMKTKEILKYKFKSEKKMHLTYTSEETGDASTLIFSRVNE